MKISSMITKNSVTVNFDGSTHTILATDPSYSKMIAAIKTGRESDIMALCSRAKHIEMASKGAFRNDNGVLMVDDLPVHGALGRQILEFMEQGLPFQPLVNFCRKLRMNPSFRAVGQLFSFLEKNRHPITENGNFIAYKKVAQKNSEGKMLDLYSHTIDNSPGNVCEMPRNKVNEDPTQTCSHGLHVANWDYAANHYGGCSDAMLEVEVDPADVVAIPNDYNESKMRVCRYVVRSVVTNPNANSHLVRESDLESGVQHDVGEEPEEEEIEEQEEDSCENCGGDCDPGYCDDEEEELDEEEEVEEDEDEDEDEDETPEVVTYHTEASMRKMSSDRLTKYEDLLINSTPSATNRTLHSTTLAIATRILDDRGVE